MIRYSLFFLASLLSISSLCSCKTGGGEVIPDSATFPGSEEAKEGITILQSIIKSHDPHKIASQFSYPIQRQYPLKDIPDSTTMLSYYDTIVDDSLESIIINTPISKWHPTGWRGWSPGEDKMTIWWDGKIYSVPYQSKKEKKLREKLIESDIESLSPELRNGWRPYYCLVSPDTHTVYRIDIAEGYEESDSALIRLTTFPTKIRRGMHPELQLIGIMSIDGSAGNRTLHFKSDKITADYAMDISDDSAPSIIFLAPDTVSYIVRPTYWLDLLTDSL